VTNAIPTLRDPQDRRLPRISPPCGLVIFGITGDLARKKLLPAIYDLANRGLLHPAFSLTGFARRDWSPQDFEEYVRASIEAHTRTGFNEGDNFCGGVLVTCFEPREGNECRLWGAVEQGSG